MPNKTRCLGGQRRAWHGIDTTCLTTTWLVFRSERLHPDLDGLRLVEIADPHIPYSRVLWSDVVAIVRGFAPHIVLHTGDLEGCHDAAASAPLLAMLDCPLGIYASCGNHDFTRREKDNGEYLRELRRYGIVALDNETRAVSVGSAHLRLIGVGERREDDIQLARAFDRRAPADLTILMSHFPWIWPQVVAGGGSAPGEEIDIVLCGHTHGGQVRVQGWHAFTARSRAGRRMAAGLFSLRDGAPQCTLDHWQALEHSEKGEPIVVDLDGQRPCLHVSRGIGTASLPLRVNCPPEVVLITLKSVYGKAGLRGSCDSERSEESLPAPRARRAGPGRAGMPVLRGHNGRQAPLFGHTP